MRRIVTNNLRNVDLNLLATLEALLTERSVTRAAKRLHLSQPSVSVQLRKLRELFDDPLLLTTPGAMTPTSRAVDLLPRLRTFIGEAERLLKQPDAFEPRASDITWQIGAADYGEHAVVIPLVESLRNAAPAMRVAVRALGDGHGRKIAELAAGTIDLALMTRDAVPPDVPHAVLYREHYVLIARRGHPGLAGRLTLDRFCALPFILMSPDGGGFDGATDVALAALGRKRHVAYSTQHFAMIPAMVAQTDLVAMLPSRLARAETTRVVAHKPPVAIPPFDMALVWHARNDNDRAHSWMRDEIQRVLLPGPVRRGSNRAKVRS